MSIRSEANWSQHFQELGQDWESRKETLIEGLNGRVDTLLEARKLIEAFPNDVTTEQIKSSFETFTHRVTDELSESSQKKLQQMRDLDSEAQKLRELWHTPEEDTEDYSPTSEDLKKWEATDEQLSLLLGEYWQLAKDEPAFFAQNLHKIADNLTQRHERLSQLITTEDRLAYVRRVIDEESGLSDPQGVLSIERHPFDLTVTMTAAGYEQTTDEKDSYGRYTPGGVILIKQRNQKEQDITLRHEQVHSLLEGAPGVIDYSPQLPLAGLRSQYRLIEQYSTNEAFAEQKERFFERVERLNADSMVNALQGEVLAFLGSVDHHQLLQRLDGIYAKSYVHYMAGGGRAKMSSWKLTLFKEYAKLFATAGNNVGEVFIELDDLAQEVKFPAAQKKLFTVQKEVQEKFTAMIEQIAVGLRVAEKIGGEASDVVDGALHILRPTQYHHLRSLLEHRYGAEQVQAILSPSVSKPPQE